MVVVMGVLILRLLDFWVPVFGGTGFWGPGVISRAYNNTHMTIGRVFVY